METRKVIKVGKCHYINIPSDISKSLQIVKGDRLKIIHLPGTGILITQTQGAAKVSVNLESYNKLQRAGDFIYEQLKSKAKDLGDKFITDFFARLIPSLVTSGIFDLKARVEKLETKPELSDQKPGKIIPLHKKKRGTQ